MIVVILNYDKDESSREIKNSITGYHTSIVDSQIGKYKKGFIKTEKPYYSGCYNKAIELFLNSGQEVGFLVCSDVECSDWNKLLDRCEEVMKNKEIGIYSPSVNGCSWKHEKPKGNVLREVPFCEGIIFAIRRNIAIGIRTDESKYGYYTDVFQGFFCSLLGMKCIIDDSITVFHPFAKSYSNKEAKKEGNKFIKSKGIAFCEFCKKLGLRTTFIERTWNRLLGKDKLYYS